jgi:hypothetical protein
MQPQQPLDRRAPRAARAGEEAITLQESATCGDCGAGPNMNGPAGTYPFVYAIGQIEVRFPSVALEKEFLQATGRADTKGLTDRKALHTVLSNRQNRYLARDMCWVLTIEGLETYLLTPRDPLDYELLLECIRETPRRTDMDVVIGIRGPIAPPEACNGLMVPVVAVDQIYSFDVDSLIKAIPRPKGVKAEDFEPRAEELYNRLLQVADNAGATDEHRALNYLATRYSEIYARTSTMFEHDYALAGVEVHPSRLSGTRKIVTVVFTYAARTGAALGLVGEQYFVRVDVTEKFPFLVTPLQQGFTR